MSTERTDIDGARRIIRFALGTPLCYVAASLLGAPLPMLAPVLFISLAPALPAIPPPKVGVAVIAIVAILGTSLFTIFRPLLLYPYLMLAAVGLIVFHAMRLQRNPRIQPLAATATLFAIMFGLIMNRSSMAAEMLVVGLCANAAVVVAMVYVMGAILPPVRAQGDAPPKLAPVARRTDADMLVSTLLLVGMMATIMTLDLDSAMRAVVVATHILGNPDPDRGYREGFFFFMGTAIGGALGVALLVTLSLVQGYFALFAATSLIALLIGRRFFEGEHVTAFRGGYLTLWVLIIGSGDAPVAKSVDFLIYVLVGSAVAIGLRHTIMSLLGLAKVEPLAIAEKPAN